MPSIAQKIDASGRGLLGTWVKIPAFETVQLIGHAGFDFVVIDMEHAPHSLDRAVELVFCAQAMGKPCGLGDHEQEELLTGSHTGGRWCRRDRQGRQ